LGGRFAVNDDAETPNSLIAIFDYQPAPLIFEVRGLPHQQGQKAMDAYRGIRVGIVVQCEHGYYAGGSRGGAADDNSGRKLKPFRGTHGAGATDHQQNFIAAMRSRRASDLNAPALECHLSTSLCHLANLSYRLGRETPVAGIRQALEPRSLAQESLSG